MSAAFVEEAAEKASWLVRREARGPGDLENAMRRIESKYGLSYSTLWALRYRKPRDLLVSTFVRIIAAYDAEIERQKRLLDHEATVSKARTRFGEIIDRTADALVSTSHESLTIQESKQRPVSINEGKGPQTE